jgi:hypothetical protein
MKVICLSILLLLATSAVAFKDGVKPGDQRRRTRGVPGNNRTPLEHTLKGGKGMGGMTMKDKKGAKGCKSLKIKTPLSEVEVEKNAVGDTVFFPVYDYYTDEVIGTFTNSATFINAGGEFVDCVISGAYNLGLDASLEFPFEDQIMIAATCKGTINAISGGTGEYACASGYELGDISSEEDFYTAVITICNTCT